MAKKKLTPIYVGGKNFLEISKTYDNSISTDVEERAVLLINCTNVLDLLYENSVSLYWIEGTKFLLIRHDRNAIELYSVVYYRPLHYTANGVLRKRDGKFVYGFIQLQSVRYYYNKPRRLKSTDTVVFDMEEHTWDVLTN